MKKSILLVALLMSVVTTSFAQGTSNPAKLSTDWQSVRASYGFGTVSIEEKGDGYKYSETGSASEFVVAYSKGMGLSQSSPVFLELAPEFSYMTCSDKKITGSSKNTFSSMGIALPVNIGYLFQVGQNAVLSPYAGLKAKVNLTVKESISDGNKSLDLDYFEEDGGAQRFQIGAQIGCGLQLNKVYLGLGYHFSLTPLVKPDSNRADDDLELNASSIRLTIGYNF